MDKGRRKKMVKARVESQKSGKQKGCGKRDRGKEKKPNKEVQEGGKCINQYAVDTDIYF